MGFIRKALSIATLGLSGLVFKEDGSKQRTAKPAAKNAAKGARARKRRTTARARTQAEGATPRKPARRSKAKTARPASAAAAGGRNDMAGELERLARMRTQGVLTDAEFAAAKARILGTPSERPAPAGSPAPFQAIEANVAAARHLADLAEREHGEPFVTRTTDR